MVFSQKERLCVVKKYIADEGNSIFSPLFKSLYPGRMKKIAEGNRTRSGFLSFKESEKIINE